MQPAFARFASPACLASIILCSGVHAQRFTEAGPAQVHKTANGHTVRYKPLRVDINNDDVLPIGIGLPDDNRERGTCPVEEGNLTDYDFSVPVNIPALLQQGFVVGEIFAASYTVPASALPLQIETIECVLAVNNSTAATTTEWSVLVWEGTPDTGTLVSTESSDDIVLPHLVLPPSPGTTTGNVIQFLIDPSEPAEQIFINSTTFTVGFRIDATSGFPGNPCLSPPSPTANAFPAVDVDGYRNSQGAGNWLFAVNGAACLITGWNHFPNFPLPSLTRPSGDWFIRATYTPSSCGQATGACCDSNGLCLDNLTESACGSIIGGGSYQGDGTNCATITCPGPTGACCFGASCLDLEEADCIAAAGTYQGDGTACDPGNMCPADPTGACCLVTGACADFTEEECGIAGGVFNGLGTNCGSADCSGACCLSNGNCLPNFSADDCGIIPDSSWAGPLSDCATDCVTCVCETDGDDTSVGIQDLLQFLALWFAEDLGADVTGDGGVDINDLLEFLSCWFTASDTGVCP